jgi:hypothetical protein
MTVTAAPLGERAMSSDGNDSSDHEVEILKEQHGRRVLRSGGRVLRHTGWWTPAVHSLLRHLQERDFPYSPRVLGIDEHGREILSYIDGDSGPIGWSRIVDPAGLRQFGRLLRAYHDAVRDFRPFPGAVWASTSRPMTEGEIICHGDFGPWNIVWHRSQSVGILDWDFAGPGRAIDDIAYALEYATPFRDDESAVRWLGYSEPPNRRARIELFFDGYGAEPTVDVVDAVASRQLTDIGRVEQLAARGLEPQATWVATGVVGELHRRAQWTVEHRSLFE